MSHELGHLTHGKLEFGGILNEATFCLFILCSVESKLSDFTGDPDG